MAPPRDQHDFDARSMSPPQRHQILFRNLKLWIEQRAIDIGGKQADGTREGLHRL